MTWKATAFTSDPGAKYSTSFQGDAVTIERAHGMVTVEITDAKRRAYFVLPEELFGRKGMTVKAHKPKKESPDDDFDFG